MAAIPESAKLFMSGLIERARKLKKTIAFPEGTDPRVLEAAARLAREGVVRPVLIGTRPAQAPEGVEFVDPANSPLVKKYAALYYERRRAKGTTQVEAAAVARKPLYFASLMVGAGDADGSVGGAVNSTAETVRAALHAVGVHPRARLVSSVFIMALQDRSLGHNGLMAFADCAVVIEPNADATGGYRDRHGGEHAGADRRRAGGGAAQLFDQGQRQAADGRQSGGGAWRIVRARAPELNVDGELQADAAVDLVVGRARRPGSKVAGRANTLIFPAWNRPISATSWWSGWAARWPSDRFCRGWRSRPTIFREAARRKISTMWRW